MTRISARVEQMACGRLVGNVGSILKECEISANEYEGCDLMFQRPVMEGDGAVALSVLDPQAFLVMGPTKGDRPAAWRAAPSVAIPLLAIGWLDLVVLQFSKPMPAGKQDQTAPAAGHRQGQAAVLLVGGPY